MSNDDNNIENKVAKVAKDNKGMLKLFAFIFVFMYLFALITWDIVIFVATSFALLFVFLFLYTIMSIYAGGQE